MVKTIDHPCMLVFCSMLNEVKHLLLLMSTLGDQKSSA
jgi:hypothetical protein